MPLTWLLSALVDDLALDVVPLEAPTGRGAMTIGIDIGGTKVAAGLVDSHGVVHDFERALTPHRSTEPRVVEDVVVDAVQSLLARASAQGVSVGAVGVGAAGFVAADRATVTFAPHLSWRSEPLREKLQKRLALAISVDNDANAAAWAEYRFGAGRGHARLVTLTLGTGIGGAIVLDGRVERGQHGMAGEFGHMIMVPQGRRCECGNRGCWEQYASGNVLQREARAVITAGGPYAAELERRCAGRAADLTGPVVTAAALAGDPAARELFSEIGRWLGVGLANLAAALDPGCIVIGGGVIEAGDLLLDPARQELARNLPGRGHRPVAPILAAQLGPEAGLIGAADLARHDLEVANEWVSGDPL